MKLAATECYSDYLASLEKDLISLYEIATLARSKGLDPTNKPEPYVARDLAEMVEGLVGPKGIASNVRTLVEAKIDKYEMAFILASDIVHAKYGHTDPEQAAEQAIRTGLAVMTGGITAAPVQGIAHVRIKENFDRTHYLAVYFAGPIRSAGGTEQALILVLADYVRKILGLEPYKASEEEVRRFVEELRLYEREVSRFQFHISDDNLILALHNLPVEATGTETDRVEVSSYRNLPRIETNAVRAGGLRVVNDGIVGRSQKVMRIVEAQHIEGWNWLNDLKQEKQDEKSVEPAYMEDIIAGRPIFAFPSRAGGFRLRYGRARNTGLAALGVHPATMGVLDGFIATGTQMRIEGPGKGCVVSPVDTIEPPIVKLKDGSVKRIKTFQQAIQTKEQVSEILFLGDLLVPFGEFLENNKALSPSGYVEEWWSQEVRAKIAVRFEGVFESAAMQAGIEPDRFALLVNNPLHYSPNAYEALAFSQKLGVPLHPLFTYFWRNLDYDNLLLLQKAFVGSEIFNAESGKCNIRISYSSEIKRILDLICVPHSIDSNYICFEEDGLILRTLLRVEEPTAELAQHKSALETLSIFSGLTVKEKAPTFVGARMGRPEKAKRREMSPLTHSLFPVGLAGGVQRNIVVAAGKEDIRVEVTRRKCAVCGEIAYQSNCPKCGNPTVEEHVCTRCHRSVPGESCPACNAPAVPFETRSIRIGELFRGALKTLDIDHIETVKGVRGLLSASRTPELLEKGILRAKYDLSVFKDGTIRFDATNAPLTHFKPSEIGVSVDTLRRLGYIHDTQGSLLNSENQICELKAQDVIVPNAAAAYLVRECRFIDDLLARVYKLPRYYNVGKPTDLIGHLILGFAPHTSGAALGRIIGFCQPSVCYAHPLWHNVKRRDCDGDEDAIMMVLDVLLNFSRTYLPGQIGSLMDAPLLLISAVDPYEVDEAQNLDVSSFYPIAFYEKTLQHADPKVVGKILDIVEHRLGRPEQFEGYSFTHDVSDINGGNLRSSYTSLGVMSEKLRGQLELAEKIQAVDADDVARRVLSTHLLRDIAGNLKAFTGQRLRCKKCNTKYRRIPLSGKCDRCGGELTMTVYKKGIEKYLGVAEQVVEKYKLDPYYAQRLELIRSEIAFLFKEEPLTAKQGKQIKLADFT